MNRFRFTTDNPQSNLEIMLNYAYVKDDSVYLRYGNGEENIELFKYLASIAKEDLHCNGCQEQTLKDDVILDCDCIISVLYTVAGQAAELREQLKRYEDKIEQGKIIDLPTEFKLHSEVYVSPNNGKSFYRGFFCGVSLNNENKTTYIVSVSDRVNFKNGKIKLTPIRRFYDYFLKLYSQEAAEQALRGGGNIDV